MISAATTANPEELVTLEHIEKAYGTEKKKLVAVL